VRDGRGRSVTQVVVWDRGRRGRVIGVPVGRGVVLRLIQLEVRRHGSVVPGVQDRWHGGAVRRVDRPSMSVDHVSLVLSFMAVVGLVFW
jgi:hypothetical protein